MNNQTNNFDDVPAGESISHEHLLIYLEQGREIEFVFQGKEYFISYTPEGRAVWTRQTRISEYFGERNKDIINFTKIDGTSLADLFKQKKAKITTIF
ncbi:hypothetical protein KHA93_05795 [Bacillus sp. FJAT-49732]|uniref:Uncharacterized protein n=1 Tax=Lederbergia citrisecunda TaxID=2833583 RepID=A0A942TJ95_9BACI|nr:hypothetical protein [Lederbergia citrisecunda]MBS4199166.1 hypothetical protein [Lederbergia citrisecunda]